MITASLRKFCSGWAAGVAGVALGLSGIACALPAAEQAPTQPTLIVVAGAPGEAEFAQAFREQVTAWTTVGTQAKARTIMLGVEEKPEKSDVDQLKQVLADEPKEGAGELWLILLGHGTFDGKEAKFNLRGQDVSASQLADWLKPFKRPLAVVDTASSSAPFLAKLAGPQRVIVSSTRSGYQHNFARFGKYFTEAIGDPKADLDKDGQVSLLESFLTASHRTAEFYKTDGRLATEHALIDDNGDGLGTPADWFKGVRATKRARDGATADGPRAHQFHLVRSVEENQLSTEARAKRDALELELVKLRDRKPKLAEDAYLRELEKLLLQLAALYAA